MTQISNKYWVGQCFNLSKGPAGARIKTSGPLNFGYDHRPTYKGGEKIARNELIYI